MTKDKIRPSQSLENNGLATVFRNKRRPFWSGVKQIFFGVLGLIFLILLAPFRLIVRGFSCLFSFSVIARSPRRGNLFVDPRLHGDDADVRLLRLSPPAGGSTARNDKHKTKLLARYLKSARYPAVVAVVVLLIIVQLLLPSRSGAATATWDMTDGSVYDNASSKLNFNGAKASITTPGSANGSALNLNPASGTKADGAAQFTAANNDYLTIPSNVSVQTGDIDFEIGGWMYMDTKTTASENLVTKLTAGDREYQLCYGGSAVDRFQFSVTNTAANWDGTVNDTTLGSPSATTWYFVRAWHDSVNNKIWIQTNNGTPVSTDYSSGVRTSGQAFNVGAYGSSAGFMNGRTDSVYFKKTISSTDEATALYNAGAGRTYADLTAANGLNTFQTNLTSWWDMNEESGTRMDSKGTNHLTSSAVQLISPPVYGTEVLSNTGFETAGTNGGTISGVPTSTRARATNVATITTSIPHGLTSGNVVTINSMTDSSYNGTNKTVTVSDDSTFTYASAGTDEGTTADTPGHIITDVFATWNESASVHSPIVNTTTAGEYHGGSHAVKITGDLTTQEIQGFTTTGSASYVLNFWARGDGTHAGYYSLWDSTHGASIQTAITTGITSAAYTLFSRTFTAPAGCTSAQVYFYGGGATYPAYFDDVSVKQVTTAATLNGGFELLGGAGSPFTNYNKTTTGTSTVNDETAAPYSYSHSVRLDVDSGGGAAILQSTTNILLANKKYKLTVYAKTSDVTGSPKIQIDDNYGGIAKTAVLTTSFVQYTFYFSTGASDRGLGISSSSSASKSIYFDNVTLESIGPLNAAGIAGGAPSEGNFAGQFSGSSQYLASPNTIINTDFSFSTWLNIDSLSSTMRVFGKGSADSALNREFRLDVNYDGSSNLLFWTNNGGAENQGGTVNFTAASGVVTGNWYNITFTVNTATKTVTPYLNGAAKTPEVYTGVLIAQSSKITLGGYLPIPSQGLKGREDSTLLINRILTTDEITSLYNNGKGQKYANLTSTVKNDANLVSFWDLDERSGTRADSKGSNTLSDNGTVTQGQGVGYFDGAVGKWTDLSAGTSFTQTTQGYKPTYSSTGLNGHPGALFDGVDDTLSKTGDQMGTGDLTIFAVINTKSNGGNGIGRIIDNGDLSFGVSGFNNGIFVNTSSIARSANSSIVAGTSYAVAVTRTSAGVVNIYLNGTLSGAANQASKTPGAGGTTYVGNSASGTNGFDGYLGPILTYSSILPSVERNQVEQTLGAKYGISVASAAGTAASSIYPTLSTKIPYYYSSISTFVPALDPASTGTLRYQLSNDPTANSIASATWYYWSGAAWTAADKNDAYESNTSADISSNISSFYTTIPPGGCNTVKWRAFFVTDGIDNEVLTSIASTYVPDPDPPTNPNTWAVNMGGTPITNASWINTAGTANFVFSGATDPISGIAGYYVYFGTNAAANPVTDGVYQAHSGAIGDNQYYNKAIATGDDGKYQYLRIVTRDKAGNNAAAETKFEFGYDKTIPTRPLYVASNPEGYTTVNSYTMSWPAGTDPAGAFGASGIKWYEYKRATDGVWSHTADAATRTVAGVTAYQEGANAFYVRTEDFAGNASADYQQITYYYSGVAPAKPTNLAVTPNPADTNSLTISWDKPAVGPGDPPVVGYWYSINATPTVNNTTWVASTSDHVSIGPDSYATIQGVNTVYVLSQNEAGNKSYEPAYVTSTTFSCVTAAPPTPASITIIDTSDKIYSRWMLTLQWLAGVNQDPATFDHYAIERGTNGVDFTPLATTVSTAYIDASGLNNATTYYYRVRAVDNAGSESAASSIVSKMPAGKFSSPPTLLANPDVNAKVTTAAITWSNDRNSSSFVRFGTSPDSFNDSKGQVDAVTSHAVTLTGLNPSTTYYYQVQSLDEDREYAPESAYSTTFSFTTQVAPAISNVQIANLTLTSADINWQTTTVAVSSLNYGTNTAYGSQIDDQSGTGGTTHNVKITGLNASTIYHFKISGQDSDSNRLTSDDYAFSTLAVPEISNLKIEPITDKATLGVRISWETNVETSTILKYYTFGISKEYVSTKMELIHMVELTDLVDNSDYMLTAQGRDQFGNLASSDVRLYKTPYDTRPPVISEIIVETNNVGVGVKDTAQVAVSWKTDEPATSQVEYGDGLSGDNYTSKSNEDASLTEAHLVIVPNLKPNSPYHLRVISKDKGNNSTVSDDHAAILGEVPKSTLQIILQTLNKMFGWITR